jgi:hypothetical protein
MSGVPYSLVLALLFCGSPAVAQTTQPPPDAPALAKVFKQVAHDFALFPLRATLTILGIGGAGALAVAPADRNADRQLAGSDYRFLTPDESSAMPACRPASPRRPTEWDGR